MNSNHASQPTPSSSQDEPHFPDHMRETLSQQVTKGLSQPPSRSQVPPATAAEEIVQ